jgi:hypothetical protein
MTGKAYRHIFVVRDVSRFCRDFDYSMQEALMIGEEQGEVSVLRRLWKSAHRRKPTGNNVQRTRY